MERQFHCQFQNIVTSFFLADCLLDPDEALERPTWQGIEDRLQPAQPTVKEFNDLSPAGFEELHPASS